MRSRRRGFTLIELMIVVAIVGILAVLASYGVRKYVSNAKTAEARMSIGQIAKMAVQAYEREAGNVAPVSLGTSGSSAQRSLCTTALNRVPATLDSVRGRKYQSQQADWRQGTSSSGWACLSFAIDNPQYFQYFYQGTNIDVRTGTFTAIANGDLTGDGTTSTFELDGAVTNGQARTAPSIRETDSEE